MTDLRDQPSQFTETEWLIFAAEVQRRAVAYAERTGKREAVVMAHAAAQTIRHLAPGGLAETGEPRPHGPLRCPTCNREAS